MSAYFEQGEDLSKSETLIRIANKAGLEKRKAEKFLASGDGLVEVQYLQQSNNQRGITGVPFYIINDKYGISGAQPSSVFIEAIKDISEKVAIHN